MSEMKPTQWDETPCEHCGESEGTHYVGRCNSVHSHKFYTPVSDSGLSYRQLVERVKELEEALGEYMSAFGQALEAHGIRFSQQQISADEMARAALSKSLPNMVAEAKR